MRTEITGGFVRDHLPPVPADADKFTRGHLFMVCGSYGMAGAAVLAARSALRTGVGYLTAAVPEQVWPVFTAAVPEAVCLVYDGQDPDSVREAMKKGVRRADAVLAGCGLGTLRDRVLPVLLPICGKPLLLDADGLNYLARAGYGTPLENEPAPAGAAASWSASPDTVLTPHAGEMARLLSGTAEDVQADRVRALERALSLYGGTVLLKGPRTLVGHGGSRNGGTQPGGNLAGGSRPGESLLRETQPDGIFGEGSETGGTMPGSGTGPSVLVNPTGTAALAAAGSGDVLAGIIASLMAQGEDGFPAAASGAWIHGRAGEFAEAVYGRRSVRPGDVIEQIPRVLRELG